MTCTGSGRIVIRLARVNQNKTKHKPSALQYLTQEVEIKQTTLELWNQLNIVENWVLTLKII